MIKGDTLNALNFAFVPEVLYPQPILSHGGAQGVVATNPFHRANAILPAPVPPDRPYDPGAYQFDDMPDMVLAPSSIEAPSWIPVGLRNATHNDTDSGITTSMGAGL